LNLCLDVNVYVADALARRRGARIGASSRIVDLVRAGHCALGPVRLVISWRMLTTLGLALRNLGLSREEAEGVARLTGSLAAGGAATPAPHLVLGGTGLLPMRDGEDAGVVETALAGAADILVTHDLGDFERGSRSWLRTERLATRARGGPAAIIIHHGTDAGLAAAVPDLAIGWLLGQTVPPRGILDRFGGRVPGA
jgi:hypothetical protein